MGLCINKSGQAVPVWKSDDCITNPIQVGTLYNTEAFLDVGSNGIFIYIEFINSSGVKTSGCLADYDVAPYKIPDNTFSSIIDYPYETLTLFGTSHKVYKLRREATVRAADGTKWGTLPAGSRVATTKIQTGATYTDHILVYYYNTTSTNGTNNSNWHQFSNSYAFVDIGLDYGSMPSDLTLYGTW